MDVTIGRVVTILSEDQVIEAVSRYLAERGYSEVRRSLTTEQGVDLIMRKDERELHIEAKGAGSSRAGSARHGMVFNSGQVFDHVAKAVLKALEVVARGVHRAGIALPADRLHISRVERIQPVLDELKIVVFLVDPAGTVASVKGL
jgi:Holliday junction resolvase-like predicted endonuclease